MCMALAVVTLASCKDDDPKEPQLATPEIVQFEQTDENPITLSVSWTAVDGAETYDYTLSVGADSTVVASGSTDQTSYTLASSRDTLLAYDTQYTFTLKAHSSVADSKAVVARMTTSAAPFKMQVTDLSYRGATFSVVPADPNMLYQTAQTDWEKYAAYDTDEAFIEDYDFGFYKAQFPFYIPWYAKLEDASQKGDYSWTTRILSPGKDYIFYTYGVTMQTDNADTPVLVSTPMVKMKVHAPEWKATSNTTFTITSVSQTVENGKVVSTVQVVPSDNNEKYFVAFAEDDYVNNNYGGSDFALFMGRMSDLEIRQTVKNYNWGASGLLRTGTQNVTNNATGVGTDANINPGKNYHVMVIGVSDDGLQTTEIASLSLTAPAE